MVCQWLSRGIKGMVLAWFASSAAQAVPPDVTLEPALGGASFSQPIALRHASDGSGRRFVVEQDGVIRIVDAQDQLLGTPFLNITAQVNSGPNEAGLLGLAFHPQFASNGRFYVHYNRSSSPLLSRISEFQVSDVDPNVADSASERVVMEIVQDFGNHNGGDIHFGPDGYLYIGMGDGGSGGDPCNRSQTLDPGQIQTGGSCRNDPTVTLLGKMLRIDVDNTTPDGSNNLCAADSDGSAEYAIPADNPYVGQSNRCGEVWSYGLRNPWRFSFDRQTGDMWIGDVGQNRWEEINFEPFDTPGGLNYGWNLCEASWTFPPTTPPTQCGLSHAFPVLEYNISGVGECAVTGGFRYRGPVISLQGYYIYGDYCSGRIWFASETSPGEWSSELFGQLSGGFGNLTSFGEDEEGNVYVVRGSGQVLMFEGETSDIIFIDGFESEPPPE